MKKRTKPCDEQDEPYIPKFTDMQWNPSKSVHTTISEPAPPDLERRIDDFVASIFRFWGWR